MRKELKKRMGRERTDSRAGRGDDRGARRGSPDFHGTHGKGHSERAGRSRLKRGAGGGGGGK